MIKTLQSLRGIFAIGILLSHYQLENGRVFYAGGAMGVVYFLMLSGFVMCAAYGQKFESGSFNYKDYIAKRLIRVYPFHWIVLAVIFLEAILWEKNFFPPKDTIVNIFAMQSWGFTDNFYGINTPSWCLGPIILFYFLFPYFYRLWMNSRKGFIILYIAIFIAVIFVIRFVVPIRNVSLVYVVRALPPMRIVEFMTGMLLFAAYVYIFGKGGFKRFSMAQRTGIEMLVIILMAATVFQFDSIYRRYQSSVMWWVPGAVTLLAFALFDKYGGFVSKMLKWRPLVYLGEASMCIYLTHYPLLNWTRRGLHHFGIDTCHPAMVVAITLWCIVVGLLAYAFVEKPLGRKLNTLYKKRGEKKQLLSVERKP